MQREGQVDKGEQKRELQSCLMATHLQQRNIL